MGPSRGGWSIHFLEAAGLAGLGSGAMVCVPRVGRAVVASPYDGGEYEPVALCRLFGRIGAPRAEAPRLRNRL